MYLEYKFHHLILLFEIKNEYKKAIPVDSKVALLEEREIKNMQK